MLLRYLPTGMLGLGFAALMASFMSGTAANLTAFNTVFTFDLYQSWIRKDASEAHYLAVARWATVCSVLLSLGGVYAVVRFENMLEVLILLWSILYGPLFATILLGMFWKRTTGHGAFTGLIAGTAAAIVHHGLSLSSDTYPGVHGGWIRVVHQYPNEIAQNCWGSLYACGSSAIVAVAVSLATRPRPESELAGLVHAHSLKPTQHHGEWWKRPEALALAILIGALVLNLLFA